MIRRSSHLGTTPQSENGIALGQLEIASREESCWQTESRSSRRRSCRIGGESTGRMESQEFRKFAGRSPPPPYENLYPPMVDLPPLENDIDQAELLHKYKLKGRKNKLVSDQSCQPRHSYEDFDPKVLDLDIGMDTKRSSQHRRRSKSHQESSYRSRAVSVVTRYRDSEVRAPELLVADPDRNFRRFVVSGITENPVEYESVPIPTEEEARHQLKKYGKRKLTYSTNAAKHCTILSIDPRVVFTYKLRTWKEKRHIEDKTRPCRDGEKGDRLEYDVDPWAYHCEPPRPFQESETHKRIPHTSRVETCKTCTGLGRVKCSPCKETGQRECNRCCGCGINPYSSQYHTLTSREDPCHECSGTGSTKCSECHGTRTIVCEICEGRRKVIHYKLLIVQWRNSLDSYVENDPEIPMEYLQKERGYPVLKECQKSLKPIQKKNLLNEEIRRVSEKYLERHNSGAGKKLKQRHTVDIVPISTVHFSYKGKESKAYLIGHNRTVFAPKYPRIGCCIM